MTAWFTVVGDTPEAADAAQERVAGAWPDAPLENLETLGFILDTARDQVIDFAPNPEDLDEVPDPLPDYLVDAPQRYVFAQLEQAKNLWNAGRVTSAGDTGMDTYTFTPRPLDKTIRSIIRSVQGAPSVG